MVLTLANLIIRLTEKEIVLETIRALPDDCLLEDIAERIEFMAAIQQGLDQLDRGEGIPHDEIKKQRSLMAYKLTWSPAAREDLHDIVIFIARDNPNRAMSFGYKPISETDRLQEFPELGRIVERERP